jgi:hypothetical protein
LFPVNIVHGRIPATELFSIKLSRIEVVLLTSTTQMQSYSIPMKGPRIEARALVRFSRRRNRESERKYRSNKVWDKKRHEKNVDEDKHEAKQRDHIWSQP